ncbi:6-phosphogluconate dehydrogenase [Spiroplasma helicoides]|uniref:6-phosphogluconate dehydrogenase n=1 Tax=Spiroplasma helicoides TaxID=216938 RepID=A0A1B3SL88_9MOLU|nr:decarboxylating 6-phosphogluconate dehydrogenase [Spiroplasma helicoides]AOG60677.1 6-phosphogluconate dehydrogenase [Spiroplasma helicoides]
MKNIGLIGLGKMGMGLVRNLHRNGYNPIGYDKNQDMYQELQKENINIAQNMDDLISKLEKPRYVIMFVNAGAPTEAVFKELIEKLEPGDCIIDAGNSYHKDSVKKYHIAKEHKLNFVDAGISGGPSGALNGACAMVGGDREVVEGLDKMFSDICVKNGYLHTGSIGSGHFAKMIHNGIEYGMMQAIAEGYQILENSDYEYDYKKVSDLWNNGSVIRSWLIELMSDIFSQDKDLSGYTEIMSMNGEGLWTIQDALSQGTPAPVIGLSVMMRQVSLQEKNFAGKVISALRNKFGGHEIVKK